MASVRCHVPEVQRLRVVVQFHDDSEQFPHLDPESKLLISWYVGKRHIFHARRFMGDLASRLANRVQVTTDGHLMYPRAVADAFGSNVDFAQLIKFYSESPEAETRYSPPRVTGTSARPIIGNPVYEDVSTSHVERNNLTMRMGMRRFTRLTNGFSKKITNLRYAVGLHFVYYNFCRPHRSLDGDTPAMRAGLADRRMGLEELAELPGWIVEQERKAS